MYIYIYIYIYNVLIKKKLADMENRYWYVSVCVLSAVASSTILKGRENLPSISIFFFHLGLPCPNKVNNVIEVDLSLKLTEHVAWKILIRSTECLFRDHDRRTVTVTVTA